VFSIRFFLQSRGVAHKEEVHVKCPFLHAPRPLICGAQPLRGITRA
jgi:hypothetical protein